MLAQVPCQTPALGEVITHVGEASTAETGTAAIVVANAAAPTRATRFRIIRGPIYFATAYATRVQGMS